MAEDDAPINQCPPGGAEGIVRLARLTGRPVTALTNRPDGGATCELMGPGSEPGREVLRVTSGEELAAILPSLGAEQARRIGERARRRLLSEHTYQHRAQALRKLLIGQIEAGAPGLRQGEEKHRAVL